MRDYGHDLRFGVFLTPASQQADRVLALSRLAEEAGLDLLSFQDHPYQSRFLDTWTLLSYLAAETERISLAPNVLNLPLRQPAVMARSVASLDILSGGRVELGLGAGAFWDAIEAMGARRLSPGQSVDALEEAIAVIREIWRADERGGVRLDGEHNRLAGAARGPAPAHGVEIWIGAYKPRMLRLTGRLADGWLPSVPYLEEGQLAAGNEAIDRAARDAGRDPREIRRLLNLGPEDLAGPAERWVERLTRYALEDGISTLIAMADDERTILTLAQEVAPAVRELVADARAGTPADPEPPPPPPPAPGGAGSSPEGGRTRSTQEPQGEYARLGVTPTPDDGDRLRPEMPWDETSRPHREPSGPEVSYTDRGRAAGQHLIDVHDHLRRELAELREVVSQVREGELSAGDARSSLNRMAMRQNDWTLGAFCSRYCRVVDQHHTIEDVSVFPHLKRSEPGLSPVIDRLTEEHLVIHDAIEEVDRALVAHINDPADFDRLQAAIDSLTDTLLSHLSYEEHELVEPLARLGFTVGQA